MQPFLLYAEERDVFQLFEDLKLVDEIDQEIGDHLPFQYNYSLVGGYFNMPSARMNKVGVCSLGFAYVPPYRLYGANAQPLERLEFAINYRVFIGIQDPDMGKKGFGEKSDRGANIKIGILRPEDGFPYFPEIAIGFEDFYGTKKFHSFYTVATQSFLDYNFETTIGYGKGRIKGWFGGVAWTPFRKKQLPLLSQISLLAEWDAINYKHHQDEHVDGREIKSRINVGIAASYLDILQLKVSSLRGKEIAASAALSYNWGTTRGFFPKIDNPSLYKAPLDIEPLGLNRTEIELSQELAYAFAEQGLNLYQIYRQVDEDGCNAIWIKCVNIRYRVEQELKERIASLLSALAPSNFALITVVIEADGIPTHEYRFRTVDLAQLRQGQMEDYTFQTLSPMREPTEAPSIYDGSVLYHRNKAIWNFTVKPRLLSFFGSSTGKYKYSTGLVVGPDGYLFDQIYYKLQGSYQIKSSIAHLGNRDLINPSQLLNVRSDTISYFQSNSFSLEQAYIQKGFYLSKGMYARLACGYFEPAYGGIATEFIHYPINSKWAIGVEAACVLKRKYHGIGFTDKIRKFSGHTPKYVHFIGYQYFLNLYYDFTPLHIDCKVSIGKFLAHDKEARFEVSRYFPSGVRFSIWYTLTSAHDIVNGSRYRDKGFAFVIPLDIFLKKSSRSMVVYALAVWLRDSGASAATGKPLYTTLHDERINYVF